MKASRDGRAGSVGREALEKELLVGVEGGVGKPKGVEGPHWITEYVFAAR